MGNRINKRWLLIFSLLAALALAGCGTAAESSQKQSGKEKAEVALTEDATSEQAITEEEEKPAKESEVTGQDSDTPVSNSKTEEKSDPKETTSAAAKSNTPSSGTVDSSSGSESKASTESQPKAKATTEKASSSKETSTADSSESTQPVSKPAPKSAPKPTAPAKSEPVETATISIKGPDDVGMIMGAKKVEIKEGDTIIAILLRAAKEEGIFVDYSGSGATAYVAGIDNVYEFDYGQRSGWVCKKNGVTLEKGAGSTKVSNGDRIEWIYTEDFLKKE
jgi:FtsZ-interacting cell division protein ZipA